MSALESKQAIAAALARFGASSLYDAGIGLLDALGYRSDLTMRLSGVEAFLEFFDQGRRLGYDAARVGEWRDAAFLRQITGEEVAAAGQGRLPFQRDYAPTEMQSYVFIAIELSRDGYARAELAQITRAVNRVFAMPAMVLLKYGGHLTLAIIQRRVSRRDASRDVLEKVTLVKDVSTGDPLRAHLEILHDLSLTALHDEFAFHTFAGLQEALEKRLRGLALSEKFYREVANWYFWALSREEVILPRSIEAVADADARAKQRAIFFIRLLTRLIFCWFLQEKGLLPRDLFRDHVVARLLADGSSEAGTYYKAVLQNLFFATLNQEQERRGWRRKGAGSRAGNRGITNLWRFRDLLADPDELETLLRDRVPFVNGGLFDCLDDVRDDPAAPNVRLDDFSEEAGNRLCLPNDLFFGAPREVDLSTFYEDARRRREKVSGLIEILGRYKFTVEENTPLEEEIALDPELLGKVFENLLASYNEDTRTTARKAIGAFYTPREIVRYLVDEALVGYLAGEVPDVPEAVVRGLLADPSGARLTPMQKAGLVNAIGRVKILDPACGSGAFPMGALHRLVDLLQVLDPNNESWKRDRLAEAQRYYRLLRSANAPAAELDECDARIRDIEHSFDTRFHELDFGRKLYLIENCIYGVDVEPIACQIAKLRFFVALLVDQRVNPTAPNLGVRPLPNLETKIVAANALVGIRRPGQQLLRNATIDEKEAELRRVRERYFLARTPATKAKYRDEDARLRTEIAALLEGDGWDTEVGRVLASWDPYNQNAAASFFDPEWMFNLPVGKVRLDDAPLTTLRGSLALVNEVDGQMEFPEDREVDSGFDVVLGNPPYVRIQTLSQQDPELAKRYRRDYKSAQKGNYDLYVVFVEAGLRFLKPRGHLAYILPHKFFNAQYGEPLRDLISKGRYLQHVVHFGDQQVFPGATNYVCLLFLAKAGVKFCRFVRVENLQVWLEKLESAEGSFEAAAITNADWHFTVGREQEVFERLRRQPRTLAQVTERISQGIRTSDNEVYVVDVRDGNETFVLAYSRALEREVTLERQSLRMFLQGREIKRFSIARSGKAVVMPYRVVGGRADLIAEDVIRKTWPNAYKYLDENKARLRAREEGRFAGSRWFEFGRTQNVDLMLVPKILVPDIADGASFALDSAGDYAFASGYGITVRSGAGVSLQYILGLANSRVLEFYWRRVSTPLRGGFYRYFTQYIEQLPIAPSGAADEVTVSRLVDHITLLSIQSRQRVRGIASPDEPALVYWERLLDGLVYELYFPEDLHQHSLRLFDLVKRVGLPDLDSIPESERLDRLRAEYERLSDPSHPLRAALDALQELEVVRIIEGRD